MKHVAKIKGSGLNNLQNVFLLQPKSPLINHIHVHNNTLVRLCGLLIVLCFLVLAGICLSEHIEESEVSKFKCELFTNIVDMTSLCLTNDLMYNKYKLQMMLHPITSMYICKPLM
ncbi:hypothetical protein GQX74_013067 [Glossina fuscipes]|nr:hypothetical protein GQX74_013067 [Glossina fuscipes]